MSFNRHRFSVTRGWWASNDFVITKLNASGWCCVVGARQSIAGHGLPSALGVCCYLLVSGLESRLVSGVVSRLASSQVYQDSGLLGM